MKYKSIYDIGDKTEIIFANDVAEYIRILSHNNWLTKFPKVFIELLNDNYDASLKAVKYAPTIYFQLNSMFKKDKHIIKTTINSYSKHRKLNEIIFDNNIILKNNSY